MLQKKNPFRKSFLEIIILCGILLASVFFYINQMEVLRIRTTNNQKKAELIMGDFEAQLELIKEVALRISVDRKYQLRNIKTDKYSERELLNDLVLYEHYSKFEKEYFLYYGGSTFFHSTGYTVGVHNYFQKMPESEGKYIRNELVSMIDGTKAIGKKIKILRTSEELYICVPFRVADVNGKANAVLVYVIETGELENRFHMVSGGITGVLSLYEGEKELYCNQKSNCDGKKRNVLTAASEDGEFVIYYLPQEENDAQMFVLQYVIGFLIMLFFMLIIANIFAEKHYRPIVDISNKYRKEISASQEIQYNDALEEINDIIDNLFIQKESLNKQKYMNERLLISQILKRILDGNDISEIESYLDPLEISLPGPFFCALGICFAEQDDSNEPFFASLEYKLASLSRKEENVFVYPVCYPERKQIILICSFEHKSTKRSLEEEVTDLLKMTEKKVLIGAGDIYLHKSKLWTSYLECMDSIQRMNNAFSYKEQHEIMYDNSNLWQMIHALSEGEETKALVFLDDLLEKMSPLTSSILMQRYLFATFMTEICKCATKCGIELSQKSISLGITARNMDSFREAAKAMIHEFCERVKENEQRLKKETDYQVFQYVKEHFADYDISIEKIEAELNISKDMIRNAILNHTGKQYKDYLIYLRIEYAKLLLLEDNMVEDVCQKVGYTSISYFTRLFKKMTGVTPARYKQSGEAACKNTE